MKMTIESTDHIVVGVGRVWRGVTEKGVNCIVLVAVIGNENDEDLAAIKPELATLKHLGDCEIGVLQTVKPGSVTS